MFHVVEFAMFMRCLLHSTCFYTPTSFAFVVLALVKFFSTLRKSLLFAAVRCAATHTKSLSVTLLT